MKTEQKEKIKKVEYEASKRCKICSQDTTELIPVGEPYIDRVGGGQPSERNYPSKAELIATGLNIHQFCRSCHGGRRLGLDEAMVIINYENENADKIRDKGVKELAGIRTGD